MRLAASTPGVQTHADERHKSGRSSMNPTCASVGINEHGRDFVVGDVHGCFRTREHALDALAFDPELDASSASATSSVAARTRPRQSTGWSADSQPLHAGVRSIARYAGSTMPSTAGHGGTVLAAGCAASSPGRTACGATHSPRCPLAITVHTGYGPIGIVHAESPDESWARVTELLESGRGRDVTLRGARQE